MKSVIRGMLCSSVLVVLATAGVSVPAPAQAKPKFQMPVPCGQVWRTSTWYNHNPRLAVDMNRGSTPYADLGDTVVASASGKVITSRLKSGSGYGNYIVVDHGGGWTSYYAHLNSRSVGVGASVKLGQKIGTVGKTGTGEPHLHYEQRYNGSTQKIAWNGSTIAYYVKTSYKSHNNCGGGTGGQASGTVRTSGASLNVRSGASTNYGIVGKRNNGAKVTIYCQTSGQSVKGTYGTSKIWNRIGSGQYIPDAYTYTGSNGRVAPNC